MESTEELKITERSHALLQWLTAECGVSSVELRPMTGDASFRRYFRIQVNGNSYVVMDAPPPQENCRPFVAVAKILRAAGLQAPAILGADLEQGFLLLTDFGDATYLKSLQPANADQLYKRALDALSVLQACRGTPEHPIPPFTADFMWKEWGWHKEWFLDKLLHLPVAAKETELDACYALLVSSAINQPQVFMHRDYHSANLMVLESDVGILDFQDAFIGPVTYDLVSLLRDCYIDSSQEQVMTWVAYYHQALRERGVVDVDAIEFQRWFDWMGIQRHLKALLTFARKQVRDSESRYLEYVPRTLRYLINVTAHYPELTNLHVYLRDTVQTRLPLCAP